MILAAGLTPAWQQILTFAHVERGAVNRAERVFACGSGKVLNVAIALQHLGRPTAVASPLGGVAGRAIEAEFQAWGIAAHWTWTAAPTRTCTTILETTGGVTTELVENAAPLTPEELRACGDAYLAAAASATTVVLTGSLPAGTPAEWYRDLLAQTPGRVVLDARGPELRAALSQRPWLVKPNREELARTVGRPLDNGAELRSAMDELCHHGAQWVVVSSGKHATWIGDGRRCYTLTPPKVDVLNPIGCGDCLAAGIAAAADEGAEAVEAVRHGLAAAADNATQWLPARLRPAQVSQHLATLAPPQQH